MRIRLSKLAVLSAVFCFSAAASTPPDNAGYRDYIKPDPRQSNAIFSARVKDKVIVSGQKGGAATCGALINIHRILYGEELRQEELEQAMGKEAGVPAGTDSPFLHCEYWKFLWALPFYDKFARTRAHAKVGLPLFVREEESLFGPPSGEDAGVAVSSESVFSEIDRALDRGKLAVVQLHPSPLWAAYEAGGRRCGQACRLDPRKPAHHPVIVLGRTRDPVSGKTVRYWIADSAPSGGAKYEVPAVALHKAMWVAAPSFATFSRSQAFPAIGTVGKDPLRPNDPGGDGADCTKGRKADAATMTALNQAFDVASKLEVKNVLTKGDPHQHLVFVALDGTSNHRDLFVKNPNLFGARSIDACIKGLDSPKTTDYPFIFSKFPTNPLILYSQAVMAADSNVVPIYVEGVGADPNLRLNPTLSALLWDVPIVGETLTALRNAEQGTQVVNYVDQGMGFGLPRQVEKAYDAIAKELGIIKAKDKDARFVFVTTGFSRGAAAARALHVKLTKEGIPADRSAPTASMEDSRWLVKPGEASIAASVLFDTVTTQFVPNPMSSDLFSVPESVYQLLHITAKNEYRGDFPLTPVRTGGRIHEIAVPGAHSDIGGSYDPQGISAVTLLMAMDYLAKAGVPLKRSNLSFAYHPTVGKVYVHDSRWGNRPDERLKTPFDQQIKLQRTRLPAP